MKYINRTFKEKAVRQNPPDMIVDKTDKPEVNDYPLQTGDHSEIKSLSSVKRASSPPELV